MDGLDLAMPGVLVRMHNIKAVPGCPPGGGGVPDLVDPAGSFERMRHLVVAHAWPVMLHMLRKDMNVVTGRELFDQGN